MRHRDALDETVCRLLDYRRIAVVGLSDDPARDSHQVAAYLMQQGYDIVPVNPRIQDVLGLRAYPDLASAAGPIDIVDVFRRAEFLGQTFDEAIRAGARAVWTQYGLVDVEGAARARAAGLDVVMNRCLMVEHARHRR
ncbi:MAG: CoA-binding protein [Deltaproteobacteria bacterium]|nr:CoA-binding protein [Deltaproteobacteria bacterium]